MDSALIEKYKQELINMYNSRPVSTDSTPDRYGNNGRLIVSVTTFRELYPVPNATVTVFTGDMDNMTVIDSSITDQSGRSKTFILPAPSRELSLEAGSTEAVFTSYGVMVKADGYADEINLNLPIFRGVTSLQNIDMTLLSAQNGNGSNINDQAENYNL